LRSRADVSCAPFRQNGFTLSPVCDSV